MKTKPKTTPCFRKSNPAKVRVQPLSIQSEIRNPKSAIESRRRNGKVARLPHETRERLNTMLRDGLPYAGIIAQLGAAGKTLTYHNLVRWRKGGYREWEQKQEHLDALRAKQQFALDALREQDAAKLHEAVLQITSTQLCQVLADLDPAVLRKRLESDPLCFVRLLTLLPELTATSLECERQRLREADRLAGKDKAVRQQNLERLERFRADHSPGLD